MPTLETVIIGGGISGLACAQRLHESGREFVLITDRLGGRMFAGRLLHNFGAAYATSDYRHVLAFLEKGPRLRRRDVYFRESGGKAAVWLPTVLRYRRPLLRVIARLIEFRTALNRLREAGPRICQSHWIRRDPLLERAVKEPAAEFVKSNSLSGFVEAFIDPVVSATVFAPADRVNTFYFLASIFPCLVPTYVANLSRTVDRLTSGFEARIQTDRVIAIEPTADGATKIATTTREFKARNVVIATPARNTREFYPAIDGADDPGFLEIPIVCLHIHGLRRTEYKPGKIVYLGRGEPITSLVPLGPGFDVLYSRAKAPDLSPYYENHEVVGRVEWKTAVQLATSRWRPLAPRPGFFTIGDHNICGLEDSYITGLFAANQIIGT
jgi:glycine/D-amino acid oxidase-like deaminating enzyme